MAERTLQSNFGGGEVSRRMFARSDMARFYNGLERAWNMLIHPAGGAEKRSGSIWCVDPKTPAAVTRIIPFVKNIDDCVAIIMQDTYMRFVNVATRAYILSAGVPYEKTHVWNAVDLPYLRFWQSADVLYIADARGYKPVYCLVRYAPDNWTLTALTLQDGPWLPDVEGIFVNPSLDTGAITLTATTAAFNAAHVGTLIAVRGNYGAPPHKRWESNVAVNNGERRYNAGRVYESISATPTTTGNNAPVHDRDAVNDGGVTWEYKHDGVGVARITGFIDNQNVTADVLTVLPAYGVNCFFAFGAFGGFAGYPRTGALHQERMALANSTTEPDTLHLSEVAGYGLNYAAFKPGLGTGLVVDSDAVNRTLASGQVEPIVHLISSELLWALTPKSVYRITGPSIDEPITPAGISARKIKRAPGAAADVQPVEGVDGFFYVSVGGRGLVAVNQENGPQKLTLIADHIGRRGFAEIAHVDGPLINLWARLKTGELATLTYEPGEEVIAFSRQFIGSATVESQVAFPKADGRDEIWIVAARTISGNVRRAIEIIPPPWDKLTDPVELACCLDGAGYFDRWNTNASNKATLTVLSDAERRGRVDVQSSSFSIGDIGKTVAVRLAAPANGLEPGEAAAIARVKIDNYVSGTRVEGEIVSDGPAALIGTACTLWCLMTSSLTGLSRLEGKTVAALIDGEPITDLVVSGGAVALPKPGARGWVGERFAWSMIDMPAAIAGGGGAGLGQPVGVGKIAIIAETASVGGLVGPPGRATEPLVLRKVQDAASSSPVGRDRFLHQLNKGNWDESGQIEILHDQPLPFEVLGIVKEVAR